MSKEPVTRAAAPRNGETDHEKPKSGKIEEVSNEVDLEGTRGVVDERLEKLNARNSEGHEKNMKAIEEAHKDNEGDEPKPAPGLGREDNGNTPIIGKDGSKTWGPPGVAGAPK